MIPSRCAVRRGRGIETLRVQGYLSPIHAKPEIVFHYLGISGSFVSGNRAVAVAVNQDEHLFGHRHAGRKIELQPNAPGVDGHKRRLQILVKPMAKLADGTASNASSSRRRRVVVTAAPILLRTRWSGPVNRVDAYVHPRPGVAGRIR